MVNDMGDDQKKPTEEKYCDCTNDMDFDVYPKVYRVSFRVYGIDSTGVKHLVIEVNRAFMVGTDVDDIIAQLKSDHINAEFNEHNGEGSMYHTIGEEVVVHSVRYVGTLSGMTTKSKKVFEIMSEEDD